MLILNNSRIRLKFSNDYHLEQGHIQGVCLAVVTGPFILQVLNITADEISYAVTAGL